MFDDENSCLWRQESGKVSNTYHNYINMYVHPDQYSYVHPDQYSYVQPDLHSYVHHILHLCVRMSISTHHVYTGSL